MIDACRHTCSARLRKPVGHVMSELDLAAMFLLLGRPAFFYRAPQSAPQLSKPIQNHKVQILQLAFKKNSRERGSRLKLKALPHQQTGIRLQPNALFLGFALRLSAQNCRNFAPAFSCSQIRFWNSDGKQPQVCSRVILQPNALSGVRSVCERQAAFFLDPDADGPSRKQITTTESQARRNLQENAGAAL